MTVVEAVQQFLTGLGDAASSPEAASALALAAELDDGANSATSKSMCARALNETIEKLRALAPPKREATGLDAIRDDRGLRLVGGAAGPH